ncbi:MAG: pitrilysin family protein [Candidatus Omnitrophota bacterium]|nr:pitrilysin family protein [Candidatus Omnitrophota bacterium]
MRREGMPSLRYMPKMIKKLILISLLAFFILGVFTHSPLNAEELDNGLKVVIREDHRNPIVVFSVFINSGSASEGEYSGTGISHLIEHMLFKGTRKYPAGSIEDILNRYGGQVDGYTSYDYTGYSITILKEHADVALDILSEMLSEPLFDQKELKKEMAVIEREMDMSRDDPGKRLSRMTFETAYIRHPYRLPPIGYKENFQRLTRPDLLNFFKKEYVSDKVTMAVVGDIDKGAALEKVKRYFGKMRRGQGTAIARPTEPGQITERILEESADIEGAYLNVSFHSTDIFSGDLYAMDILSFLLGQGESSVLNENLRMKEHLLLSVSAYNYTPQDPGLFIISSAMKEENARPGLEAILSQIESLKKAGVSEEDLAKAKNNFIADYAYQKEKIESQANDLAESQILTGNPDFFRQYIEKIKAVSPDDIKRVASRYLNRQNMTVTALSKSGNALKIEGEPGLAKENQAIQNIIISGNVPVVMSENHSLPIIAVSIVAKAGVRAENENNNGISMLTSQMLLDGTGSMSRSDMARLYESRAISLNTYSGNNSLGINITCLKEHIEDALKLASDICLNPSFPEDEFNREKDEIREAIDMQDNDIVNHGQRLLKELLFKVHPYRLQTIGTISSIGKITRSNVQEFYKKVFSANNIVIGVSGDFKSEDMKGLIEKYFSKIPAGEGLELSLTKEPGIEKIRESTVNTDKDQSLILIGFPGIDIYDKDRYSVELLSNMLSSPSGVLFKSIREEKGLTYAVGAFNAPGLDPGYMAVYALTSKENIEKTQDRIFMELDKLAKNGVKTADIERSKNYLKAMRKVSMQANSSFIFSSAMDELYGLGFDDYKNYDRNIDAVTLDQVKQAARRLLTLDRCAVLILQGK